MQKKPMKLTCPNLLLHSPPNDALIYCVIEKLYRCSESKEVLVVPDTINYYINKSTKISTCTRNRIIESLDRLVENNYLSKDYILDTSSYYNMHGNFTMFDPVILDVLIDKPGAFLHCLNIINMMSLDIEVQGINSIICKVSIDTFAKIENTSKRSILSYNKVLEDLKLIYIRRSKYSFDKDGREINAYCLYENKHLLNQFADYYTNSDNDKANFRRKVSAMYNRYKKNPNCYTSEQIEQLRKDINKYNAEMLELGGDYVKKIKTID